MRFRQTRLIQPEILDHQTPERALPSLRDIVRINRLTGGHNVLRQRLAPLFRDDEAFTILDAGSAMGDAAIQIRKQFPRATVYSLDYRFHHVLHAPPPRLVADAFHLPLRPRSFDAVYCGLFLHHFTGGEVVELLRAFGAVSRRFVIVNDLERHLLPFYFLPATSWLFGWDPVTLHDGPVSVQAAFTGAEIEQLARAAGLRSIDVRVHRPAFRVSMVAERPDDTLGV